MAAAEKFLPGVAYGTSLEAIGDSTLMSFIRAVVWKLYEEHKNDPVVSVRKWGIRFTIRVHHLRPLLERWFGKL